MITVKNRTFEMIKDVNASLYVENISISECIFDNCLFSKRSTDIKRSVMENIVAEQCRFIGCQIGPGFFRNCRIRDCATTDLVIFWGSIFENVTLTGRLPGIKINTSVTAVGDKDIQMKYDADRLMHYKSIGTAIDISNARFNVFDCRGIPADLFRIDCETQAIVRRDNISNATDIEKLEDNAWFPWIASFFASEEEDVILATPLAKSKARRDKFLSGIAELRSRGIADPA